VRLLTPLEKESAQDSGWEALAAVAGVAAAGVAVGGLAAGFVRSAAEVAAVVGVAAVAVAFAVGFVGFAAGFVGVEPEVVASSVVGSGAAVS
jgi:hypothetical protein